VVECAAQFGCFKFDYGCARGQDYATSRSAQATADLLEQDGDLETDILMNPFLSKMNESEAKEQITGTIIDVLLCLKPEDKARRQIFQILSKENGPNTATARCMIKDVLRDNGHAVDHERIQLCIHTFQGLTNGFSRQQHHNSPIARALYPAWELTKLFQMEETVNWTERWQDCGGKIYSGNRLIATIDDPIWLKISDFGLPFPPFALNSGMGWREIGRAEAEELGVIQPGETGFGGGEVKLPRGRFDPDLLKALSQALKSGEVKFRVKVEIVKDEKPH